MIVNTIMLASILSIALIGVATGSSYSNVYVGREVIPMEYYQYGAPYASIESPRLSEINSVPHISSYGLPCGSPCIYPGQPVATVTAVNPNANVLTLKSPIPNVPVIVTPTKEVAPGYEYSYVVYDENTGDHKAQRELSDGSVVRGEYSFIQPDGYVREVQYVADDISGFNAVVKHFLPIAVEGKKVEVKENKESSPPCHDVKNESLKAGSLEESEEGLEKYEIKIHDNHNEKESKESGEASEEKHYGKPINEFKEESPKIDESQEKHEEKLKKESKEDSGEESDKEDSEEESDKESNVNQPEKSKKDSEEESKEEKTTENSKEKHEDISKKQSKESVEESGEKSESEDSKEKSKEELKEESRKKTTESKEESKVASREESEEKSQESISHSKHEAAHELIKPEHEALVPYDDVLRCIQAAIKRAHEVPSTMREEPSPLTYIILNKPC